MGVFAFFRPKRRVNSKQNESKWELWQEKWDNKKVDKVWGEKLRNRDWERDPAYEIIADKCKENGKTILDIGSGGGVQYAAIKEYAPEISYTGADITPRHVEFSRKMFPEARFKEADAGNLPFKNNEFDVSIIRHLIEHHPKEKAERILKEAFRVSKKCVLVLFFIPPVKMEQDFLVKKKKSGFYLNTYSKDFINGCILRNLEHPIITTRIVPRSEQSPALTDQELYIIEL